MKQESDWRLAIGNWRLSWAAGLWKSGGSRSVLALVVGSCALAHAAPVELPPDAFFTSKMIPKAGDRVRVGITLGKEVEGFALPLTVELHASSPEQPQRLVGRQTVTDRPSGEQPTDVTFDWQPSANDWHRLTFTVTPSPPHRAPPSVLSVRVPVVDKDLYFAWFGSPTHFKWCNVPTTVKEEDEVKLWLRRGAWPCHWKGGVCYKEWPTERFADSYAEHKWIAIDEVGGPGEVTDKIVGGIREHKRRHPDGFVAVWYMGAHDYWRDVADVVDLFLPEIYLNYRGNHLGQFDSYLRAARETGTIDKCIPTLGINIRKDKDTGEVLVAPTKEDVLRQIRHLKRLAPDWPGVGFFTSYSASEGVAEYGDQLCEEYYLDPVLSVGDIELEVGDAKPLPGEKVTVRALVSNVGGTPARRIRWEARWAEPATAPAPSRTPTAPPPAQKTISDFKRSGMVLAQGIVPVAVPGERVPVEFGIALPDGIRVLELALGAQEGVTLLDGASTHVVAGLPALAQPRTKLLSLPPSAHVRRDMLVSTAFEPGNWVVEESDASGIPVQPLPSAARARIPGGEQTQLQFIAVGGTPAGERRHFVVRQGRAKTRQSQPASETLTITRSAYQAEVSTADDSLVSLKVNGGKTEILHTPWSLKCQGHSGMQPPTVTESALGTEVLLPFDCGEASGATRYTFYHQSPIIEIARRLVPKAPLTLKGASEGCNLEQRGGTFALQPGVGGPVKRGKLQDGKDYRDLLFGYTGERPRPDNADKCGWFDFSWPQEHNAGLGVVLAQRWQDAAMKSYDVTRYYDAADWLQINYLWGTETTIERPQESVVYLLPHGSMDMTDENVVPPAQALWETLQAGVEVAN